MNKKHIVFFVIFILCITLFTSCTILTAPVPSETEEQPHQPELIYDEQAEEEYEPIHDYGQRIFTVASYNEELFLPSPESSPISDKILDRNKEVEKAFNIRIQPLENVTKANFIYEINSRYNSGLPCGDIVCIPNYMLPLFVSQKSLMSIKALPGINLDAECYNKKAIDSATIGNFVHAMYGDITYMPDKSVCMFFNKDFVSQNELTSPYDMQKDGSWTWDTVIELAKQVKVDVNWNYKKDFTDIYGISSSYQDDTLTDIVWASCGNPYFSNTPPYMPKMNFNNEKTQIVIDKIRRLLYNDVNKVYFSNTPDSDGEDLFIQGRSLFCIAPLEKASAFSAAGINFGIMPLPEYEGGSGQYYSYVDSSAQAVCVLNNITDSDFTGTILQYIAENSSFNNSDYYKKYYVTNFLTDNSSALMLDKIFANPYLDLSSTLGEAYQEVGAASSDIIHANLSTGAAFNTLYDLNNRQFETFVKNNFTYKGE